MSSIYSYEQDAPVATALADADVLPLTKANEAGLNQISGALLRAEMANGLVPVTAATLAVTKALHAGHTVLLDRAAGQAVTLPAASGSGDRYRFLVKTTITSNGSTIKVANASDAFIGSSNVISDDAGGPAKGFIAAAATDDTVTLNGTTTGGYAGDLVEIQDVAANLFAVRVTGKATGTEATPFSATV